MNTATPVKVLSDRQTIYKLTPPLVRLDWDDNEETHEFVVVSGAHTGHASEVLVFPSDGERVTSYSEIGGSYGETQGHVSALKDLGYKIGGESPEAVLETIRNNGRNLPKAKDWRVAMAEAEAEAAARQRKVAAWISSHSPSLN
jgi:hypothetical protein